MQLSVGGDSVVFLRFEVFSGKMYSYRTISNPVVSKGMTEEPQLEYAELWASHQQRLLRYVISLAGDAEST